MRSKKFKRISRSGDKTLDLDITSLLDILVILLVFLLKSFNSSDLKVDLVKNIELPNSISDKLGNHSVIIQVDRKKQVFVDNKMVGSASMGEDRIPSLYKVLQVAREKEDKKMAKLDRKVAAEQKKKRQVNLVMDQNLEYAIIKKVMHTAAEAGYPKFKFIVEGNFD